MLVLHVHIMGKAGNVERTYDFLRNDGKDGLEGCDLVIPYNEEEYLYPIQERDAVAIINSKAFNQGDH
jgi:hypothetical protein